LELPNLIFSFRQGVSKNVVVEELLATMALKNASPDFVLCVENVCSDEDTFTTIMGGMNARPPKIHVG
jgi:hypothetical protein